MWGIVLTFADVLSPTLYCPFLNIFMSCSGRQQTPELSDAICMVLGGVTLLRLSFASVAVTEFHIVLRARGCVYCVCFLF